MRRMFVLLAFSIGLWGCQSNSLQSLGDFLNMPGLTGEQSDLVASATASLISLTKSQAIMADALGLKEQSALAAKTAKDLESGDLGGKDGLETAVTNAESVQREIDKITNEKKQLSADSKVKFATALPPYGVGLAGLISTTQKAISTASSVANTRNLSVITKLGSLVFLAQKAPTLISTFSGSTSSLIAFSKENQIPTGGLEKEIDGLGFN
jgi:hypothetical protein